MQVEIYHTATFGDDSRGFVHVASFAAPANTDEPHALEMAYERTQNVHGSWSRGPVFDDGEQNNDHSSLITVRAPLPVHDGVTYGLRSSSVNDVFLINGAPWRVASMGFEALGEAHPFVMWQRETA